MNVEHNYVFKPDPELSNEENFERMRGMICRILENNKEWTLRLFAVEAQEDIELDPLEFNNMVADAIEVADKIDKDPEIQRKLGLK